MLKLYRKRYETNKNKLKLQDDKEVLFQFKEYDRGYIGDVISEIADRNVSIFTSDILDSAKDLYFSGAYEEASFQGLLEGSDDLIQHLQMAWYEYNTQLLYSNIDNLILNYAIEYINTNNIIVYNDTEAVEDLENNLLELDNNDSIECIIDIINHLAEVYS